MSEHNAPDALKNQPLLAPGDAQAPREEIVRTIDLVKEYRMGEEVLQVLKGVELGHRHCNKPSQLSGGQQQRVAIARAFANDPAIILADEPTGNLDLNTGNAIIELLRQMNKERAVTVISATHDFKMLDVSDRIIWIRDGTLDRIEKRADVKIAQGEIH